MGSGIYFTFVKEHRERLLDDYARRVKAVSPADVPLRRFVFFFQRSREFGEPQELVDIK